MYFAKHLLKKLQPWNLEVVQLDVLLVYYLALVYRWSLARYSLGIVHKPDLLFDLQNIVVGKHNETK